ncbi:MAG: hypothetical protein RMI85_04195, partial [Candidatus Korarchaeum sp.]|nr:hypothetical protein [Candidatus Korarchaeum sp.]
IKPPRAYPPVPCPSINPLKISLIRLNAFSTVSSRMNVLSEIGAALKYLLDPLTGNLEGQGLARISGFM